MLRLEGQQLRHDEKLNAEVQELRVKIEPHFDIQGMLERDGCHGVEILKEIREEDASRRQGVTEGEALKKRFAVFQGLAVCVCGCVEGVCQRITQLLKDIAVATLQSWDKSSLGVRIVLFCASFRALT